MRGPFLRVWGRLLSPGLHYAERERREKTSIEQLFLSCKYCLAPGPLLAPHSFLCFEILPLLEDHLRGSRLVHNAKLVSAVKLIKEVAHIKNVTDLKMKVDCFCFAINKTKYIVKLLIFAKKLLILIETVCV